VETEDQAGRLHGGLGVAVELVDLPGEGVDSIRLARFGQQRQCVIQVEQTHQPAIGLAAVASIHLVQSA
jgi:hypothetical protein